MASGPILSSTAGTIFEAIPETALEKFNKLIEELFGPEMEETREGKSVYQKRRYERSEVRKEGGTEIWIRGLQNLFHAAKVIERKYPEFLTPLTPGNKRNVPEAIMKLMASKGFPSNQSSEICDTYMYFEINFAFFVPDQSNTKEAPPLSTTKESALRIIS